VFEFLFWDRKFKNKKVGGMWGAGRAKWSETRPNPTTYPRVLDLRLLLSPAASSHRHFTPSMPSNFTAAAGTISAPPRD
jgi:hypothetical protein